METNICTICTILFVIDLHLSWYGIFYVNISWVDFVLFLATLFVMLITNISMILLAILIPIGIVLSIKDRFC